MILVVNDKNTGTGGKTMEVSGVRGVTVDMC